MLAKLRASVDDVNRLSAEQSGCLEDRRAAIQACGEGRRTVIEAMRHVVTVSAFVEIDEGSAQVMRRPRKPNDRQLIDDARAILDKASTYAEAFVDAGLPEHVLVDLPHQIDALESAIIEARACRHRFGAAGKSMQIAIRFGDDALKVLTTILKAARTPDVMVIERLRLARRVGPMRARPRAA